MNTKIHINLKEGLIEAEGSEDFVKYIYESAKELYNEEAPTRVTKKPSKPSVATNNSKPEAPKKKVNATTKQPKIVADLNLRPTGGKESLEEFCKGLKIGKSSREKNLVYIYYMQKVLGIEKISMDHVYTCYKHVKEKCPGNLYQNLVDTKNKRGWIVTSNMDQLSVTVPGENYLEHEMQKKAEE